MTKFFQVAAALVVAVASTSPALAGPASGSTRIGGGVTMTIRPPERAIVTIGNGNTASTGSSRVGSGIICCVNASDIVQGRVTHVVVGNSNTATRIGPATMPAPAVNTTNDARGVIAKPEAGDNRRIIGAIGAP